MTVPGILVVLPERCTRRTHTEEPWDLFMGVVDVINKDAKAYVMCYGERMIFDNHVFHIPTVRTRSYAPSRSDLLATFRGWWCLPSGYVFFFLHTMRMNVDLTRGSGSVAALGRMRRQLSPRVC